jgi:hypothetical protein
MCCFSGHVNFVRSTKIFARALPDNHQALAYGMTLRTPKDVAMILPIPVAEGSDEKAVQFVALDKYPDFFDDLERCFPNETFGYSKGLTRAANAGPPQLEVVKVGSFNASFVPTIKDFSRLDAQFRLPDGVWEKLGQYAKYGFAVFKLRKGEATVHPMAFTFPTALPGKLFFPTVHIHDGQVHARAGFDHALYAQPSPRGLIEPHRWKESEVPASARLAMGKAAGLVHGPGHIYRRTMIGQLKNEDVIIHVA